jgi:hypothetical protein
MPKLITTDEQLRSHLPNIIATVKGETPFIERLALFLDLAEDWVVNTFTSVSTFNTICGYTDSNPIRIATARLVVADALRRAIPSLDIVLSPTASGLSAPTTSLRPQSLASTDLSALCSLTATIASPRYCPNCRARASGSPRHRPTSSGRLFSPTSRSLTLSHQLSARSGSVTSNSAHRS